MFSCHPTSVVNDAIPQPQQSLVEPDCWVAGQLHDQAVNETPTVSTGFPRSLDKMKRQKIITIKEDKKKYFTSSDPHRDIILLHICHKF